MFERLFKNVCFLIFICYSSNIRDDFDFEEEIFIVCKEKMEDLYEINI